MSPIVSVVIPTYNRAGRLPAAIDSVLRQAVAGLEIIVVDDGSHDDTRAVVATYGDRARYVYQPNAGVGAARNTGIRAATGETIAFLDSDDRWQGAKLSMQLELLRAYPAVGMVFSDFVIENSAGTFQQHGANLWAGRRLDFPEMSRVTLARTSLEEAEWPTETIVCWIGPMYRQLLEELPILTSSVIVRRAALDDRTWYAERVPLFEDWEFFARVARRAEVGYLATATTVNVGHSDPGRVSRCSRLDRAVSYQTLVERVWLDDEEFMRQHPDAAPLAHARALLTVAREALLAGRRDDAATALDRWQRARCRDRAGWARLCGICARLPGGRTVLRVVLKGRTALRLLTGASGPFHDPVNPAA